MILCQNQYKKTCRDVTGKQPSKQVLACINHHRAKGVSEKIIPQISPFKKIERFTCFFLSAFWDGIAGKNNPARQSLCFKSRD